MYVKIKDSQDKLERQHGWQTSFTVGRANGYRLAKGKADKLRDGQRDKSRPEDILSNAGYDAGFNFGWEMYRTHQKRKLAKKDKTKTKK